MTITHRIVLGLQAGLDQQLPDCRHELLHEWLELLVVLLGIQANVLANLRTQMLQNPRILIIASAQRWHIRGQLLNKRPHPRVHVVLEELWQILGVQREEHLVHQHQRAVDDLQSLGIVLVHLGQLHGGLEQVCQWLGHAIQHKFDLLPQSLRLELIAIALEQRVSGLQDAVDDIEIARGESLHHLVDELWPFFRKIMLANDTDSVA